MLRHHRHLAILKQLEKKESLRLEKLIGEISTSESTLRRDIDYLSDTKPVRKVSGGITRVERVANESRLKLHPFPQSG